MSATAAAAFAALHQSGCFVLPNPWDAGSAIFLESVGFRALASTSAGMAFARGLPDDPKAVPCDAMLAHLRELVAATKLPVNADFQNAYADDPEGVARNVTACVHTGVGGLSVEDATGDSRRPLYDRALAIERVRAARAAIDATGVPVVLTARSEAWLVGDPEPARTAIDRLVAFAAAGADCLYAPGVRDAETIGAIVRAVAPKPVNLLVGRPIPGLTFAGIAELGVRRVSVGGALSRVAFGAFMRAARDLYAGSFDALADAAGHAELDALFRHR
ncbi:MAG TPA: isocitrate lyase/phosphoenolpyruvate mutase family protein [Polyangia bacterium]